MLEGGLHGRVISFDTTYGDSLCPGEPAGGTTRLHNCMVKTKHILNFRQSPGGAIFSLVPWNVTLTAFQRTPDWFYVDLHGERGWITADYVIPQGDCG